MGPALLCAIVSVSAILCTSCSGQPTPPATQPAKATTQPVGAAIPPADFALLIGKPDHVLLDVRTPEEYAAGHLAGAMLIDFHSPDFQKRVAELPRNKTYLVYCRSGRRSHGACEQMEKLGFGRLVDMQGGILAWQEAGRPVEPSR